VTAPRVNRAADILAVDDTPANLLILIATLNAKGHRVRPVLDGRLALEVARRTPPELILLDIRMPGMDGFEVCAHLKEDPLLAEIPVIFISSSPDASDKVQAFAAGGVDYVTKPFHVDEVIARVEAHLKIRRLQVALDQYNRGLQEMVRTQVREISESQIATIFALAKLSESRDDETGHHIVRVQRYFVALARRLCEDGVVPEAARDGFLENIFQACALHDIGKVGIPDSILLKPGELTPGELEAMKRHTLIGAETLAAVLEGYPGNAFVRMGVEVTRSHHERWDGSGYPDGLSGEAIPLAARIVMLADQYDALRNKRPYKGEFDAERTYAILTEGDGRSDPRHVDPRVLAAFKAIRTEFDAIHEELREPLPGGRPASWTEQVLEQAQW